MNEPIPSDAEDPFVRLARESGRLLGELGVRPEDRAWIDVHARSIASLAVPSRPRGLSGLFSGLSRLARFPLYRLARRAARTAR